MYSGPVAASRLSGPPSSPPAAAVAVASRSALGLIQPRRSARTRRTTARSSHLDGMNRRLGSGAAFRGWMETSRENQSASGSKASTPTCGNRPDRMALTIFSSSLDRVISSSLYSS